MIPWLLSSPESKGSTRRYESCSCDVVMGGSSHQATLRDLVIEIPSLHLNVPLSLPDAIAPCMMRQQDISILNRFNDDLIYLWICCELTSTARLLAFKVNTNESAPISPKIRRFSSSTHGSTYSDRSETNATLQLFSFKLPGKLLSMDILDSEHGRASFVAFHCSQGKEVLSCCHDMRLVLRYAEKVNRISLSMS